MADELGVTGHEVAVHAQGGGQFGSDGGDGGRAEINKHVAAQDQVHIPRCPVGKRPAEQVDGAEGHHAADALVQLPFVIHGTEIALFQRGRNHPERPLPITSTPRLFQ
jgi:hypothetical protein